MQFESVLELRDAFLKKNHTKSLPITTMLNEGIDTGVTARKKKKSDFFIPMRYVKYNPNVFPSLVPPRRKYFGFGYIAKGKNDYELDLRLQNPDADMCEYAEQFRDKKAKGEARIAVINDVKIPSKAALLQSSMKDGGHPQLILRRRPLHLGLSVCREPDTSGTLGAFVCTPNGDTAILSNSHILGGSEDLNINRSIFQSNALADHCIGYFEKCVTIDEFSENRVDAAYAFVSEGISHQGNLLPRGFGIPDEGKRITDVGSPTNFDVLPANSTVAKLGRTTGYTSVSGDLDTPTVVVTNQLVYLPGVGEVEFNDILEIPWEAKDRPFSKGGDSGSLVFVPGSLFAIGLHFASGIRYDPYIDKKRGVSFACNILDVLEALNLALLV